MNELLKFRFKNVYGRESEEFFYYEKFNLPSLTILL